MLVPSINEITFLSGNPGKLQEAREILGSRILAPKELIDLPEIQSTDPREVIQAKIDEARKHFTGSFIVEDTSLFLTEWGNGELPGPLVKFFLRTLGDQGFIDLAAQVGRTALAVSQLGFFNAQSQETHFFEGELRGRIALSARGENGFGWDPIFEIGDRTFAELSEPEKNRLSMRRVALDRFRHYLQNGEHNSNEFERLTSPGRVRRG